MPGRSTVNRVFGNKILFVAWIAEFSLQLCMILMLVVSAKIKEIGFESHRKYERGAKMID